MRILQVAPYFFPSTAFGGSAKVAYELSQELAKRNYEVIVYTSDVQTLYSRLNKFYFKPPCGMKIYYMKNLAMIISRKFRLFITPQLMLEIKKNGSEFDVIHLHEYRTFQTAVVASYAKKHRIPYVIQAHGSLPRTISKQKMKRVFDVIIGYKLLRNASKVIALTEAEAQQYLYMGVAKDKIEIVPNGIDLCQYACLPSKGSFRKKFNISSEKRIILYLGRINESKGLGFLVHAYAYLINIMHYDNVLLVLAGPDDGYLKTVKSLVDSLGLSGLVLFTGLLSEKDKISAYVDSAVCAYLGPFEPFGLVPLEAAACGTPVIVSKGTYIAKIVDKGRLGFSTKFGDVNETVSAMRRLLDDDLSKSMNLRAIECAKQFDIQKTVDKIERLYRDLVSNR